MGEGAILLAKIILSAFLLKNASEQNFESLLVFWSKEWYSELFSLPRNAPAQHFKIVVLFMCNGKEFWAISLPRNVSERNSESFRILGTVEIPSEITIFFHSSFRGIIFYRKLPTLVRPRSILNIRIQPSIYRLPKKFRKISMRKIIDRLPEYFTEVLLAYQRPTSWSSFSSSVLRLQRHFNSFFAPFLSFFQTFLISLQLFLSFQTFPDFPASFLILSQSVTYFLHLSAAFPAYSKSFCIYP